MIDAALLTRLERLQVLARSVVSAGGHGKRPTRRPGRSLEFHDYRHYASGDELRYLDWNVYARHGSLFIKEFAAEENLHVAVVLDVSASMGLGQPAKIASAKQLAMALVYVGLCNFDSAGLFTVGTRLHAVLPKVRGKVRIHEFLAPLEGIRAEGGTDFAAAFAAPLPEIRARTVALVVSDFLDVEGTPKGMLGLLSRGAQVHMIQVVSQDELNPVIGGRTRFRDAETGVEREIYVSARAREGYRRAIRRYLDSLRGFARNHEIRFAQVLSSDSLEQMIVTVASAGILERF